MANKTVTTAPIQRPAVLGADNWEGLIGPSTGDPTHPSGKLQPDLQRAVETYADLVQVAYDLYAGHQGKSTAPPPETRIADLKLSEVPADSPCRQYVIPAGHNFRLHATSGIFPGEIPVGSDETDNWIGFVAISEAPKGGGPRDVAVVFRGTEVTTEWISDVESQIQLWDEVAADHDPVKVAKGFEAMYRRFDSTPGNTLSVQGQVHVALSRLLERFPTEIGSVTVTGHSLGGALASMCSYDVADSGITTAGDQPDGALIPVTAFTFEAPRVGNAAYAAAFAGTEVGAPRMLRIVNQPDIVPTLPSASFNVRLLLPWRWPRLAWSLGRTVVSAFDPTDSYFVHGGREYTVNTAPQDGKDAFLEQLLTNIRGLTPEIHAWHNLHNIMLLIRGGQQAPPPAAST